MKVVLTLECTLQVVQTPKAKKLCTEFHLITRLACPMNLTIVAYFAAHCPLRTSRTRIVMLSVSRVWAGKCSHVSAYGCRNGPFCTPSSPACIHCALRTERPPRLLIAVFGVGRPILIHKRLAQRCQMFWIRHRRVKRADRDRDRPRRFHVHNS